MACSHTSLRFLPVLLGLGYLCAANNSQAQGFTAPEVLIGSTQGFLEFKVEEYLQNSGLDGRYQIQVNRVDPRLRLAECDRDLTLSQESPAQPIPLELDLRLLYLNTSSIKAMMDILDLLEEAHQGGRPVSLRWHYDRRNERVAELAEEFREDCSFPFAIQAHDE